ncbi:MAG: DUF4388 domain-containing protein [Coriobacteriia bacterium]
MALRGNLKDFSLPDVFQLVQLSGKTGVLRIQGTEAEGSIWFRDGDVFFAQSNWRREQLGERLVSAQRITPAALARALDLRAAEPDEGRRLGEILVNEGYITQQVLEAFVQEQIQDTIFDLMRWDEGEFDFEVLPSIVHEDIGLSVSVENIVMEGARRLEEWQRIKKKVPSTDMVFKMATAPGEGTFEISLKPVEWALLLLIDGTRSVRELAVDTHSTDFEVARVVYGLFSAGLLEVPPDDEIERLRADRARRDDKRAKLEGERAAREAGELAATLEIESKLAAEAEERRAAEDLTQSGSVVEEELPAREDVAAPAAPGPDRVVEEPEFLAAGAEPPSPDDMAVFEQMMASVLTPQGVEPEPELEVEPELLVVPELKIPTPFETEMVPGLDFIPEPEPQTEPEPEPEPQPQADFAYDFTSDFQLEPEAEVAPAAEPTLAEIEAALAGAQPMPEVASEFLQPAAPAEEEFVIGAIPDADLSEIPAPPVADTEMQPDAFTPSGDFEADLRSLGLGELPEELLRPEPPTETRVPMSDLESAAAAEPSAEFGAESVTEPESEPEYILEPESEPELESESADADLDSLLASLEAEAEPASAGVISSGTDYGSDDASEGVISTDAFLAEFDGVGLSGGLGDELTALTGGGGAGRSRPVATVSKLPEEGESHMLHRDEMVDRSLLEKIIEGVENL